MGKHNKHKSQHSQKKSKKKEKYSSSDSESSSNSSNSRSKTKKYKKFKAKEYSSSSSPSGSDCSADWVEKSTRNEDRKVEKPPAARDEWLSLSTDFKLVSNIDKKAERDENKRLEREQDKYNPRTNIRELNPFWKDGGDGLPAFKKPDNEISRSYTSSHYRREPPRTGNWRKKHDIGETSMPKSSTSKQSSNQDKSPKEVKLSDCAADEDVQSLTSKELNDLAAKIVKAEIMGNAKLADELKKKLELARSNVRVCDLETVILTRTDAKGYTQPVKQVASGEINNRRKKQRVETHTNGNRVRYFPDDDKYSLKQMFENEKFSSVEEQNGQFLKLAGKMRKNDDMDDVFADNICNKESDEKVDKRNKDRAINEHKSMSDSLDNCKLCLQSSEMQKHLMVTMGENMYLGLPSCEPLTEGHCFIIPIKHTVCATQLDENEWDELKSYRRCLTKYFLSRDEDVIFLETAMYLHKYPHMKIECIPVPKEVGDMAPIYFKKAIDESETEWAVNKKLVSLKGRDVRKAVPKGLPYFSVSFGMDEGFAHVIEDQQNFPSHFGHEIIGGMLDLDHSKWRKPHRQRFEEQSKRVVAFSQNWASFDPTN